MDSLRRAQLASAEHESAVGRQLASIARLWDQGRLSPAALNDLAVEVLGYIERERARFETAGEKEAELVLVGLDLMEETALALGMHPWEELRGTVEVAEEHFQRARALLG